MENIEDRPVVKVYSKPNCQPCRLTCKKLDLAGIPYEVIDLTSDPKAMLEVEVWGYSSVPVVSYKDIRFSGFSPVLLDELIRRIKGHIS